MQMHNAPGQQKKTVQPYPLASAALLAPLGFSSHTRRDLAQNQIFKPCSLARAHSPVLVRKISESLSFCGLLSNSDIAAPVNGA